MTRIGKARGTPTDRVRLDSRLGPVERRRPRPWRTEHVTFTEAPVGLGQAAAGETSATGRSVHQAPVVGSTGSVRRSVRRAARRSLPVHQRRGVGSRVEGMHRSGRSPDDRLPARSLDRVAESGPRGVVHVPELGQGSHHLQSCGASGGPARRLAAPDVTPIGESGGPERRQSVDAAPRSDAARSAPRGGITLIPFGHGHDASLVR